MWAGHAYIVANLRIAMRFVHKEIPLCWLLGIHWMLQNFAWYDHITTLYSSQILQGCPNKTP